MVGQFSTPIDTQLEAFAGTHWYPPVREAARKAIEVIQGKSEYESKSPRSNFAFEFFAYEQWGKPKTRALADAARNTPLPKFADAADQLSPADLQDLSYGIADRNRQGNERGKNAKIRPACGLKVHGGYVVGSDRGEWGGELAYLDNSGKSVLLVEKNVHGIYHMPFGVVAVAGLAHLTLNEGTLYLVKIPESGSPTATPWKALPGAPERMGMLKDGRLFIECAGGRVVVTPEGQILMAEQK
jgi:hypothetical protein